MWEFVFSDFFLVAIYLGQHIKEFTDFLSKHTDTFEVIDECVVLVGCENMQDVPLSERLHLPQPSIDTAATQQMLDFFAQTIESNGPILVDQLFHMVTAKFPQQQWFSMFKTPSDLCTFLKLFSDCFHIQSNLVTLLHKPILSDHHIKQEQARTKDCINNNYNHCRTQSPIPRATQIGDFKLNEPVSNVKVTSTVAAINANNNDNTKSEPNSGFDSFFPDFDVKLENLCNNNCPSSLTLSTKSSTASSNNVSPAQSPITVPSSTAASDRINFAGNKNQSLKQRINNLVIRTLAENSEKDKHTGNLLTANSFQSNNNNNQSAATVENSIANSGPQLAASIANNSPDLFNGDTWKIKVLQHTRVIATVKESQFVTDALMKSASNNERVIIALDCEGINLGIKGELTLVEIGTVRGEAFIFDVLTCPAIVVEGGLKALLENEKVIKIIHDCRNDSVNLFIQYKILLRNVFDTQSAHALLQYQEHGKQVYKVKNISLNTLCDIYNAPKNPMKDQLKNIYRRDQKYWSRRPLSRDMLLYAAADVLVLINDQLYSKMAE